MSYIEHDLRHESGKGYVVDDEEEQKKIDYLQRNEWFKIIDAIIPSHNGTEVYVFGIIPLELREQG